MNYKGRKKRKQKDSDLKLNKFCTSKTTPLESRPSAELKNKQTKKKSKYSYNSFHCFCRKFTKINMLLFVIEETMKYLEIQERFPSELQKKLKNIINYKDLHLIYCSLILSYKSCCVEVWELTYKTLVNSIVLLQKSHMYHQ